MELSLCFVTSISAFLIVNVTVKMECLCGDSQEIDLCIFLAIHVFYQKFIEILDC